MTDDGGHKSESGDPVNPNRRYSREEAARMLGVTLRTLKSLISAGYLHASKRPHAGRVLIDGDSLLKMLKRKLL